MLDCGRNTSPRQLPDILRVDAVEGCVRLCVFIKHAKLADTS